MAPSEEGDIFPLDDDSVMDVYNMSNDELHNKIVQARRNNFPDDHASPTFIRERVIVVDSNKNPNSISEANSAFVGAERSNTQYLMAHNKKLAQKL